MPRPTEPHPDYLRADPKMQFTGSSLGELFPVLSIAALRHPKKWHPEACRIMPRGAWVQMRANAPDRLELRILRQPPPADAEGWKRFGKEVATFRGAIAPDRGRHWGEPFIETISDGRYAAATIPLLLHNEVSPGKVRCSGPGDGRRCDAILTYDPAFPQDRCTPCATIAGAREARENFERHADRRKAERRGQVDPPYGGAA